MSDQRPDPPWVDHGPPAPPPGGNLAPPGVQPPTNGPHGSRAPHPPPSPLANIERLANISLGLSIFSILCGGIILSIIAYVLASKAERDARALGKTSSDGRIRTAKTIAIVATVLWVVIMVAVVISSAQ